MLNNGQLIISGTSGDDTVTVRKPGTPVAYWTLNDPNTGTTVTDSAANPDNGTYYYSSVTGNRLGDPGVPASLAPYGAGTAADFFYSKNSYIGIPDSSKLHLANGTINFDFWPRFTVVSGVTLYQTLFSKGAAGDPNSLTISLDGESLVVTLGGNTIQTGPLISDQTAWYDLSFSFGSGGMQLYLNGVLVGQNSYTGGLTENADDITLGGSNASTPLGITDPSQQSITNYYSGLIGQVSIFDFALPPQQIQNVMQKGAATGSDNPNGQTIEVYASFLPGPTHIMDFPASDVTSILAFVGPGDVIVPPPAAPLASTLIIDQSVNVPATIFTGDGNDTVYAGSGPTTITGGNGNDILVGGPSDDIISAGHGTDFFVGGGGDDVITGGGGNDTIGLPPSSVQPISYWTLNDGSAGILAGANGIHTSVIADQEGVQNGTFYAGSGVNLDLTEQGPSTTLAPYGAGTAAGFIGSAKDFIGIANNPDFEVANGSVSFWFNASTLAGEQTLFSKASNGPQDVPLTIGLDQGRLVARLGAAGSDSADGGTIESSQSISANTWYSVTFSFGAGGTALYLNGNLVGTSAFMGGLAMNLDPIVLGASNASTPTGRANPAGQVITNPFNGEIDDVAFYGQSLDQTQAQGMMVNGPLREGAGLPKAGFAGGLANYTFAYVNGTLQVTNVLNGNVTQIVGVGTLTFGDGTVGYVLNASSPNLPFLTLSQIQSLAPDGKLVVIGDGNLTFQLIKPTNGPVWTAGTSVTIGQTGYVPWTTGSTTVLVINGQPASDPAAVPAPLPAEPGGAPISAVAIEPTNPSELMSLIHGGNITIPVQESVATTSNGPQTLLFDEDTGALMLTVNNRISSEPALLIDSLGEEWVLIPGVGTAASLVEISGSLATRNG